jgi:RNA polymerase sigma-70 factor (ECF subfamily)
MVEADDFSIITKVLQGDTGEFAKIIEQYQQPVYRLVVRMVGDEETAKDLTQNIFIKAYTNLGRFNPNFKFFSWLYRIAIHETLNYLKTRREFVPIEHARVNEIIEAGKDVDFREQRAIVRKAVLRLKPKYRLLIVLKYYGELSYEQISSLTKLPEKKIRSRLYDARQMLRNMITEKLNSHD